MTSTNSFSQNVSSKLKIYVYRLIDPRNGETFYVGKGKRNRVFARVQAATQALEGDELSNKIKRIHEIHLAGLEIGHVIHRHGMEDKTAFEVEAALVDAYPGLSNEASGYGSDDFGPMHAREIIQHYDALPARFHHKALLIGVNRSATEASLYEATRYAWRLDVAKARRAEVILPTVQGLIVGAFVADEWLSATSENFTGRESVEGRFGFVGRAAPAAIHDLYVGRSVLLEFRKRGAVNPIKYTWKGTSSSSH
jgi:hypothetical protein